MPPRGKEGAIRKRTSANAPPLAAHCPLFCAATLGRFLALSACLRACACGARSASASAARKRATCHNKHTYYCQFGFLRVFSVENHLNLSVVFSVKKGVSLFGAKRRGDSRRKLRLVYDKDTPYSQLILLGIKNQEITPLSHSSIISIYSFKYLIG